MKSDVIFDSKKLTKSIVVMSVPIIISNFLMVINGLIDMYLLRIQNIDQELLRSLTSALTMTTPILSIFQAVLVAFCAVELTLISQSIGEKEKEKTKELIGKLFTISVFIGILLIILLIISCNPLLKLMKTNDNPLVYKYGKKYITIISFDMISFLVTRLYHASRYAIGDATSPMILSVIHSVINIIITKILINKYLIVGIALGTTISGVLMIPIYLCLLTKTKNEDVRLEKSKINFSMRDLSEIASLIIPSSISGIITAIAFILINRQIMAFDDYKVVSIGSSNRIYNFIMIPFISFQTITTTFVSQNMGAKNYNQVQKSISRIIKIVMSLSIIELSISLLLKDSLVNFFIKTDHEVLNFSRYYIKYLLWTIPVMAYFYVLIGILHGLKKMKATLILSVIRLWILRLPLLALFINYYNMNIKGLIISMFVSNIGTVSVGTIYLLFYYLKTSNTHTKNIIIYEEKNNGRNY